MTRIAGYHLESALAEKASSATEIFVNIGKVQEEAGLERALLRFEPSAELVRRHDGNECRRSGFGVHHFNFPEGLRENPFKILKIVCKSCEISHSQG